MKWINYDFYKDHSLIPIEEVASLLGMTPDAKGKYLCPCHNDTHPSMELTTSGKYENRFTCWACGESGTVFNLAMAVLYQVTPSELITSHNEQMKQLRIKTAEWIEQYFPGAIQTNERQQKRDPFAIPAPILQKIGLSKNLITFQQQYDSLQHTKTYSKKELQQNPHLPYEQPFDYTPRLTKSELAKLICNKITEALEKESNRTVYLLSTLLPNLSLEGKLYINEVQGNFEEKIIDIQEQLIPLLDASDLKDTYLSEDVLTMKNQYNNNYLLRKQNIYRSNLIANEKLHNIDKDFPILPKTIFAHVKLPMTLNQMIQIGYSTETIADTLIKTIDSFSMRQHQIYKNLIKEFPQLSDMDKTYIQHALHERANEFSKYASILEEYIDTLHQKEIENEIEIGD